jgi:EAL domain-containing protein (putative c-di-GMP-specific phosphodiesterase class I)
VAGAAHVARLILETFETQFTVEGQAFDVDLSIGIAAYPDHGASPTELLRQADVAMYVAKRSHSGYAVYDAAQDHHDSYRIGLMSELRHALAGDELALYYQPLVDMAQGDLIGAEALLRWQHPEHGLIPPDKFIPLAEHTGVIGPLTEWVLERALQQCQAWRQSGLSLGVQVNLSMRVLHDLHVPVTVADLLQRYGIAPEWLTLEITESALMVDPGRALEVLTRLSALGVRIAIDDFGTGYSSLGYLKRLPVDEVKIDKSFVLGMDQDAKDATIVRSVIALAHAMGLAVVAEGIETGEALTLLRSLSCDVAQGYYLSRPLPGAEFERWVDAFSQSERRASA